MPLLRIAIFEVATADGRLRRALRRHYPPGTGIFLVGGFSAQPFKPRHRRQSPCLRVEAPDRCVALRRTSGNQVLPVRHEIARCNQRTGRDSGFHRSLTTGWLVHVVHLRTATLPVASSPCSRCTASAHRPCIAGYGSRGTVLPGSPTPCEVRYRGGLNEQPLAPRWRGCPWRKCERCEHNHSHSNRDCADFRGSDYHTVSPAAHIIECYPYDAPM